MADQPNFLPATADAVEQLAELEAPTRSLITVYIDLDPSQFGTPQARQSQINSTLSDLGQKIDDAGLDHDAREAALRDLEAIRERFGGPRIDDADGARAIAVFICEPAERFDVMRLFASVPPSCAIGEKPHLEPIADLLGGQLWTIALVSRTAARLFRGNADAIREVAALQDQVHRQHAAGGWSQKRFERSVDKEVQEHLIEIAEMLYRLGDSAPEDRLLVGCTEELYPLVEQTLHADVAKRLVGRIDVDVENSSVEQVLDAAAPAIDEFERAREREVLDQLAQELGRGGRAVASENDVRRALTEQRVEVLVLEDAEGAGEEIDMALQQSADVLIVRHHDDLQKLGSIAALLRY